MIKVDILICIKSGFKTFQQSSTATTFSFLDIEWPWVKGSSQIAICQIINNLKIFILTESFQSLTVCEHVESWDSFQKNGCFESETTLKMNLVWWAVHTGKTRSTCRTFWGNVVELLDWYHKLLEFITLKGRLFKQIQHAHTWIWHIVDLTPAWYLYILSCRNWVDILHTE